MRKKRRGDCVLKREKEREKKFTSNPVHLSFDQCIERSDYLYVKLFPRVLSIKWETRGCIERSMPGINLTWFHQIIRLASFLQERGGVVEQRTPSCQACLRERHPRAPPQSSFDPITILSDNAMVPPSECHRATSVSRLRDSILSISILLLYILPISILNLTLTIWYFKQSDYSLLKLFNLHFCRKLLF